MFLWSVVTVLLVGAAPVEETLVTPSVRATVGPDGAPLISATFVMREGWHIYWRTPGDSGMATEMKVELPGATLGPVEFPTPHRFTSDGSVTYGYERSATIFVPVTSGRPGTAKVRLRWLACDVSACVPGSSSSTVPWPPAEKDAALGTLRESTIPRALARAPVWKGSTLVVTFPEQGTIEYFPELPRGVKHVATKPVDGGVELVFSQPATARLGVLTIHTDGKTISYDVTSP